MGCPGIRLLGPKALKGLGQDLTLVGWSFVVYMPKQGGQNPCRDFRGSEHLVLGRQEHHHAIAQMFRVGP